MYNKKNLVSCSPPIVPTDAHISNHSAQNIYLEGMKVIFQCNNGSHAVLTTMCDASGSWSPHPSELDCTILGLGTLLYRLHGYYTTGLSEHIVHCIIVSTR